MSERDGYEPGVPCWVESLQADPGAAMAFYETLFGWEFLVPAGGDPQYFVARLRGRDVAGIAPLPPMSPEVTPTWMTHVQVASTDEAAERARANGGAVLAGPFDALPAGRIAVLEDPTGAGFCAWEARSRKGAQLVNEPGAWAMSQLATPDPERAAAFYADLFGWTTESFGAGDGAVTLFRLPGYVGGEPEQPVSREVVAVMARSDAPSRWTLDFWVADVDAAVGAARELGGRVVAEAVDNPIGRTAALEDPWGAGFTVSRVSAAP